VKRKRLLFISGSIGLGHVTRDLSIARELRRLSPGIDIVWLAAHPATMALEEAGEKLLPEARDYADESVAAERAARGYRLNLLSYIWRARHSWVRNVALFRQILARETFDIVVGDESYEIVLALRRNPHLKTFPFFMIFDFVGLEALSRNPLERLGVYVMNLIWSHDYRRGRRSVYDRALFAGEEEDVPDTRFGPWLPGRREFARAMYTFVGPILPFDLAQCADRPGLRQLLGYGHEPLVICSIGGTGIGREMLELCAKAYPLARVRIPGLRMVLVCGPRLPAESLHVPPEVEVRGFVPRLFAHYAVSDLAIVQGGGTTTMELAALRRPFLYFPLEGHSEQADVAAGLARRGAGVWVDFKRATPRMLADLIASELKRDVTYPPVRADGARRAAELILTEVGPPEYRDLKQTASEA